MKRFSVFLVIMVCLLTMGLIFVSCDDGSTGGGGGGGSSSLPDTRWTDGGSYILVFSDSSNWILNANYASNCASGNYTVSGNNVTLTCTYENTSVFSIISQGDITKLKFKNSTTLEDENGRSWVKL